MIHDGAELLSLTLTVPTVVLSIGVVRMFFRKALEGLQEKQRSATQWFAIGITIGFLGSTFDNLYWSIPWSASFLQHSLTGVLVENGVYFNIPFRQLCGIAAAYCHIRCAIDYRNGRQDKVQVRGLNQLLLGSLLAGVLISIALTVWKLSIGS